MKYLLDPDYWLIFNYPYSEEWDAQLNLLLDKYEFTQITGYSAKLGDVLIRIGNHPYGSFTPYIMPKGFEVRASRKTIYNARKKLLRAMYGEATT